MAVKFYRSRTNTLLLRISGTHFGDLVDALHHAQGRFRTAALADDGEPLQKMWEVSATNAQAAADAITKIEPRTKIPDWLPDLIEEAEEKARKQAISQAAEPLKPYLPAPPPHPFREIDAAINPALVRSPYEGKTDYQEQGILRGIRQNRLALFWEQGLGKTFVIQTILNHLIDRGDVEKYVIICPPEGLLNFKAEMLRFNSFGLTEDEIYICDKYNRKPFENENIKAVLMTYRTLIMLHDDYYKETEGKKFTAKTPITRNYIPFGKLGAKLALVCDESAAFKNYQSKTWKVLNKAKAWFDYRYILTGTPAPRYAADLYTQLYFLDPAKMPRSYLDFITDIADTGNKYSVLAVNYYYPDQVQAFMDKTAYLVSREKMQGNIDLPELIMAPILCPLPPKQKELYDNVVDYVLYTLKDDQGEIYPGELKSRFMLLCTALHDPALLAQGSLSKVKRLNDPVLKKAAKWKIEDNGKYEAAASLLEKYITDEGRKVILWSGHPAIIDSLTEKFASYKPIKLHGSTDMEKNETVAERNARICKEFLDSDSPLLIANYSVLTTSVNLTAVTRNIYWDTPLRQDVLFQSIKRSHRIGTTEPVIANFLLFPDTLEETLYNGLMDKNEFNDNTWARQGKLSTNELEKLFPGAMFKPNPAR